MIKWVVVALALAVSPATAAECSYANLRGGTLDFADPMTVIVSDYGKTQACRLLSAGTGVVLSRGVGCTDNIDEDEPLHFQDETMSVITFRGQEWVTTCPDNTPMDIEMGN